MAIVPLCGRVGADQRERHRWRGLGLLGLELGYDEIRTEMLEREEAIRSRRPDGVRQELWGLLLA